MDRRVWQVTVYRVTQSWTRLKRLSTQACRAWQQTLRSGGGDREQAWEGQTHEMALNPRALQDQVKAAETASQ